MAPNRKNQLVYPPHTKFSLHLTIKYLTSLLFNLFPMRYNFKMLIVSLFFMLNNDAFAQKSKMETRDQYLVQAQTLAKSKSMMEAFKIIDELEPVTVKELIELTEIPAPPFKESVRAQKMKQLFETAGADKVWIDSIGNVLALRHGKKSTKTIVLDAHLDTVFPEFTDVTVKHHGDTLYAPGISDDTRGLITILTVLRALEKPIKIYFLWRAWARRGSVICVA
jgi:tripeptide aminopeptidase